MIDVNAGFDYQEISMLVTATGPSSTLAFTFSNEHSFWLLDDVSVNIPEPGSAALAAAAALALVLARACVGARPDPSGGCRPRCA